MGPLWLLCKRSLTRGPRAFRMEAVLITAEVLAKMGKTAKIAILERAKLLPSFSTSRHRNSFRRKESCEKGNSWERRLSDTRRMRKRRIRRRWKYCKVKRSIST